MASLAAIVLAAGRATRFGDNKLLRPFNGAPLVTHAINAACAAPVEQVVIVRRPGAELDRVCQAAARDVRVRSVESANEAMSDSLRAGLAATAGADGTFVFLGDVPLIPASIPRLLATMLADRLAVVPTFEGKPGHPVLLSARAAELATALSGDQGAGALLRQHAEDVTYVETQDERVILDIDTIEDFERLSQRALKGNA